MRGFLMEHPDRSRGVSMGLSRELPGHSPSWADSRAKPAHKTTPAPRAMRMTTALLRLRMADSPMCAGPRVGDEVGGGWCRDHPERWVTLYCRSRVKAFPVFPAEPSPLIRTTGPRRVR